MKLTRMTRTAGWLAVAGLLGAAVIGPTAALATDLHQTPPITASDLNSQCDGSEGITQGQVYWHFVLVDAETTGAKLTATFKSAGTFADVASYKVAGNATHFAIVTPTDDTLLAASTDIDGSKLNLSHVCYGTTTTTTSSETTSHDDDHVVPRRPRPRRPRARRPRARRPPARRPPARPPRPRRPPARPPRPRRPPARPPRPRPRLQRDTTTRPRPTTTTTPSRAAASKPRPAPRRSPLRAPTPLR